MSGADELVWYAAFGTNLSRARMACYVGGGRPLGAARSYEGCRDPTPPREVRTFTVPGRLRFAGESGVWGGGMAFFTPREEGLVCMRAYLLRVEQLGDLVAQETRHPVGRPLVLATTGPTRHDMSEVYDVVLDLGELDGRRLLSLSSTREHPVNPPSAAYVRTMLDGLADGFDMDAGARVAYLAAIDGVRPHWTIDGLRRLLVDDRDPPGA